MLTFCRNKEVREISFDPNKKIGKFPYFDFVGDGSFYLFDVPGHAVGHISGLARTTPTTFIFVGGDICHFNGNFRPTKTNPLPDPIPDYVPLDRPPFPHSCACSMFTSFHPHQDSPRTTPYYNVTEHQHSAYIDNAEAERSIRKMQEFDDNPNVLVCIAHDPTLQSILPLLNNDPKAHISDWKEKEYKEKAQWGFLNELPRDGKPGRKPLVIGLRRDGEDIEI